MSRRAQHPAAPHVRYSTTPRGRSRGGSVGGSRLIAGLVVLAVVALVVVVALIAGGLALIGFGLYVGVLAHRRREAEADADAPTVPIPVLRHRRAVPASARKVAGLHPSYGLGAACVTVGAAMFVGGVTMLGNADEPQDRADSVIAAPPVVPVRPSTSTPATTAPAAPQPVVSTADTEPAPTTPPPSAPEAAESPERRPRPQPAPPPTGGDGSAVYYKNCGAVRAAGAGPIGRDDPGYRPELDRDGDGKACG